MRKIIIFIIVITVILPFATYKLYAADNSASAITATPSPTNLKIKELKDHLASRVAQLNILSKKVFFGEVKTLSDQKIIISSEGNEITINLNDEVTFTLIDNTFKKKTINLDSLKVGQSLAAWGTYNSTTNTITVKSVVSYDLPLVIVGEVKGVDKKNFQFNLQSQEKNYLVDINLTTKIFQLLIDDTVQKTGFSKISEGQTIYVVGAISTDKDGKELFSAQRITILSNPPVTLTPTSSPSPTPTKPK